MKTLLKFTALMGVILLVNACSPKPQEVVQRQLDMAPWFILSPPQDTDEFLYSTSSFVGSRRDVAQRQAELAARTSMATKLGGKIEALEKLFQEEVTSGERSNYASAFTLATQSITSQRLVGVAVQEVEYKSDANGRIEAFVLVRMPVGAARAALENALSNDEELFIRFKESRAFQELQENLERL